MTGRGAAISEDSQERYGGVLAAPARPGWRTVLGVLGAVHVMVAALLTAVVVTPHGTDLGGGVQPGSAPGPSSRADLAHAEVIGFTRPAAARRWLSQVPSGRPG